MLALSNKAEKAFSVYRARVDGTELTDNEVRDVLRQSKDSTRRRAVWEASKRVGRAVDADLKQLVRLRNESARKLGFRDYHVMQLALDEQSQDDVLELFDELDALTRQPFHEAKARIDAVLSRMRQRARRAASALALPGPVLPGDARDLRRPARRAVREDRHGEDVPRVLRGHRPAGRRRAGPQRSVRAAREESARLLQRHGPPGRRPRVDQHCAEQGLAGDAAARAGPSTYSSKNIPARLPYVLRTDAHTLSTEAVAMMFEKFAGNADWLAAMGVAVPDAEAFKKAALRDRRNQLLIFSRWCQVMFRFEKALTPIRTRT